MPDWLRRLPPGLLMLVAALVAQGGTSQFYCFHDLRPKQGSPVQAVIVQKITPAEPWNELIPSWNLVSTNSGLQIEVRVRKGESFSKWYHLGHWAVQTNQFLRQSVREQDDAFAKVATDTLVTASPAREFELRVTLAGRDVARLDLLTVALTDTTVSQPGGGSFADAWGKELKVPERSQTIYPEGINEWCSPTSLSMILGFWSAQSKRLELDLDVPTVAGLVNDPHWPGTGNWPFNTAFAGSFPGLRAYVTRLDDLKNLEQWIASGIPLAASVSNDRLKGLATSGSGHLIVPIGFTATGDLIANDPGRSQVRQVYPRGRFANAWAVSHQTVYIVHPVGAALPEPHPKRPLWCRH